MTMLEDDECYSPRTGDWRLTLETHGKESSHDDANQPEAVEAGTSAIFSRTEHAPTYIAGIGFVVLHARQRTHRFIR
jgi:hypothetical protein